MIRVRFAPSPTGHLHQGNVRTALFNFLYARHHGGKVILRIEDTDQERSQPEYEASILSDLQWLGLHYDEGLNAGGELGPYRQSDRLEIYKKYLQQLEEAGKIYSCFCTQEDLENERRRALATNKPYRYSGKCRELTPENRQEKKSQGLSCTLRFNVGREIVKFHDLVYGEKVFDTATIGDFVLARSNELPLYLFTCAVDDALMQISHVIRGEDGMSNTPRQILIQKALGFEPPQFAHLPLILGPDHTLLSKRNGSTSIAEFQAKGYLPQAILNYLALLGWSPGNQEILDLPALVEKFDLSRISRSSAIFDWAKLNYVNQVYLSKLSEEDYLAKVLESLPEGSVDRNQVPEETLRRTLLALRPNIQTLGEIPGWLSLLLGEPAMSSEAAKQVLQAPETPKVLSSLAEILREGPDTLEMADYQRLIDTLQKRTKVKGKKLFMPIRVALTGGTEGPELAALVTSLGKAKVLERIHRGIESVQQLQPLEGNL